MKKIVVFLLSALLAVPAVAQLNGNGYYRVQSKTSDRYIVMIDNKSTGYNTSQQKADIDALLTVKPFTRVSSDPSSVIYVENVGGSQYNLKAQGTDAHAAVGYYLKLETVSSGGQQYYRASATASGITLYLYDINTTKSEAKLATSGKTLDLSFWSIIPVDASADNYFGIQPEFTAGGVQYSSLFASFPFTFASTGMKAYTVTKIDGDMAVWQELSGKVAAGTPVIIQCVGSDASANRLNLEAQDGTKPSDNLLQGVYFNNTDVNWIAENIDLWKQGQGNLPYHFNATPYDPNTMRLLGVTSAGKLGFVKSDVEYIPRNRAYINVPAGSPDEITLVTQAEYDALVAADQVTVTANDKQRYYGDANPTFDYTVDGTLKGTPVLSCAATETSPVGTYPIVVSQGTVSNRVFNAVNGTLTVANAPVSVTARSYTIKQNEELPQFAADYSGFKLDQTASVLTQQPTFACEVPADKAPGTYPIYIWGAEAPNYDFTFNSGTLTIVEADPITVTANDATMVYGDDVPQLSYTISAGEVEGEPVVSCEATSLSQAGTYDIVVSQGTVSYPNIKLVNGTLTIQKAQLTATVGNYSREEGDENPVFEISYEGFRNGDTPDVFTVAPVAATEAGADSPAGDYPIVITGGEAQSYDFVYVNGVLTVTARSGIQSVVAFSQPVDVYSLTGRLVRSKAVNTQGLPRGIYIVNGRKLVIQ